MYLSESPQTLERLICASIHIKRICLVLFWPTAIGAFTYLSVGKIFKPTVTLA